MRPTLPRTTRRGTTVLAATSLLWLAFCTTAVADDEVRITPDAGVAAAAEQDEGENSGNESAADEEDAAEEDSVEEAAAEEDQQKNDGDASDAPATDGADAAADAADETSDNAETSDDTVCAPLLTAISPGSVTGDARAVAITSQALEAGTDGWDIVSWQTAEGTELTAITVHRSDGDTTLTDSLSSGTLDNVTSLTFCGTSSDTGGADDGGVDDGGEPGDGDTSGGPADGEEDQDDADQDDAGGATGGGTSGAGTSGAGTDSVDTPTGADSTSSTDDATDDDDTDVDTAEAAADESADADDDENNAREPRDDPADADADEDETALTAEDDSGETEVLGAQFTRDDSGLSGATTLLVIALVTGIAAAIAYAVAAVKGLVPVPGRSR